MSISSEWTTDTKYLKTMFFGTGRHQAINSDGYGFIEQIQSRSGAEEGGE